jgi:hypothetical protein
MSGWATPGMNDSIGRFAITGRLGEGGMGVVLAGRDEDLDRKVAVKVLSETADPGARAAAAYAAAGRERLLGVPAR